MKGIIVCKQQRGVPYIESDADIATINASWGTLTKIQWAIRHEDIPYAKANIGKEVTFKTVFLADENKKFNEVEIEDFVAEITSKPKSYALIKGTPDGGGVADREETVALSISEEKLKEYAKNVLKEEVVKMKSGGPERKFSWEPYYYIAEKKIPII